MGNNKKKKLGVDLSSVPLADLEAEIESRDRSPQGKLGEDGELLVSREDGVDFSLFVPDLDGDCMVQISETASEILSCFVRFRDLCEYVDWHRDGDRKG